MLVINTERRLSGSKIRRLHELFGENFTLKQPTLGGKSIYERVWDTRHASYDLTEGDPEDYCIKGVDDTINALRISEGEWSEDEILLLICNPIYAGLEVNVDMILAGIGRKTSGKISTLIFFPPIQTTPIPYKRDER